jgi:hypothetical protein
MSTTLEETGITTGRGQGAAGTGIRAAQAMLSSERRRGLAALDALSRSGQQPEPPLYGRYRGQLIALDVAPGLTRPHPSNA